MCSFYDSILHLEAEGAMEEIGRSSGLQERGVIPVKPRKKELVVRSAAELG